jgi:hypothetical protein
MRLELWFEESVVVPLEGRIKSRKVLGGLISESHRAAQPIP